MQKQDILPDTRKRKDTGNQIATYDPYDGIGIMDSYFQKLAFTEFERFDRHLEKLKEVG